MKLKVLDKTIDFFEHNMSSINRIAVSSSIGTDSTILLYLTALYLPDKKIIPYCIVESQFPKQKPNLLKIVDYLRSKLPNKNLTEPLFDYVDYNSYGSEWRLKAIASPGDFPKRKRGNEGRAKTLAVKYYTNKRLDKGDFDYFVSGTTSNPPIEVLKELRCDYEEERSNRKTPIITPNFYSPFHHIDKRYIAELWKKYDLMEIFNLTISCINCPLYENWFSTNIPCKKCYFCSEKKWAFGMYDGGIK
jgi:hypothetical protein